MPKVHQVVLISIIVADSAFADSVLLEAESFETCGGWVLDQQFMDIMGSPYLLAHGLGEPVADASTRVRFSSRPPRIESGYVRATGSRRGMRRGRQADFKCLSTTRRKAQIGTRMAVAPLPWELRQLSPSSMLPASKVGATPSSSAVTKRLCRPMVGTNSKRCAESCLAGRRIQRTAVVIIRRLSAAVLRGTAAAVSAARVGLSVALIQDPPVLGDKGSSEVRVWPEGKTNLSPYPRIRDIVSELVRDKTVCDGNANTADVYDDERKLVVLTAHDILSGREFEDGCFPCTWYIDLHLPHPDFAADHEGEEFIAQATSDTEDGYEGPYWAPYRCLFNRNVPNLFMAGRDISVPHEALGAVRVMRTYGCMREIVGIGHVDLL